MSSIATPVDKKNISNTSMFTQPCKILIIDDDPKIGWIITDALNTHNQYQILTAENGKEGLELIQRESPDIVLLDIVMPIMDGISVLKKVKSMNLTSDIVMVSGKNDRKTVVEAIRIGAADFISKPISMEELTVTIRNLQEKRNLQVKVSRLDKALQDKSAGPVLIGESKEIENIRQMIIQVAPNDVPVLLLGESGTGKEITARAIHRTSNRAQKSFVKVNCAALPETLLESELFGYEKGAFSGAQSRKPGRFEFAHEGTIFLDEISEIKFEIQAKLLHVLQEGEYTTLGGTKNIRVDSRVIAASNRDIEEEIARGNFRSDLYYRINGITITLPPLREHKSDIPILMDYFKEKYNEEYDRAYFKFPKEVYDAFMEYDWPGNIRELENYIKRIIIFQHEKEVLDAISQRVIPSTEISPVKPAMKQAGATHETHLSLKEYAKEAARQAEKTLIEQTLYRTNWNRTKAAKLLGISYKALLYKIKSCGLDTPKTDNPTNSHI